MINIFFEENLFHELLVISEVEAPDPGLGVVPRAGNGPEDGDQGVVEPDQHGEPIPARQQDAFPRALGDWGVKRLGGLFGKEWLGGRDR